MSGEYDSLNHSYERGSGRKRRNRRNKRNKQIIIAAASFAAVIVVVGTAVFIVKHNTSNDEAQIAAEELEAENQIAEEAQDTEAEDDAMIEVVEDTESDESEETDDTTDSGAPADPGAATGTETGAAVDVAQVVSASSVGENASITYGIDVSKFQGTIDWAQAASSGINFAMVRVGYRDKGTGEIKADTNAKYNMQEAEKNGIKIGAYFFSTAVTKEEAIEEADWVANYIAKYPITYPVGYNCEGFENNSSRQFGLTKDERSSIAIAFLNEVYKKGYTPIFYASRNELNGDTKWNTSEIQKNYKIWMAWYNQDTSNLAAGPSTSFKYAMWQYTNQGTVAGIPKKVDVDVAYFGYNGTETAKDTSERETAQADVEALMKFTDANETVTAKSKTNLRDKPSQGSDSTVKVTLTNGQTATRTGISNSGWSRVVYDGATYYAVSSYLTTDLSAKAPETSPQAENPAPATDTQEAAEATPQTAPGFKTKFTDCNEVVTAKERVNLRSKPSVTDEDSMVVATLYAGTSAVRTGYNSEYGWSRIEYNGQVLYCVSSYIKVVE